MVEFEPSQGTQQAAAGVPDPRLHDFTPFGYDQHQAYALSQLYTVTTPDAISDVMTSNAGRQKVFTVANPPTRWDVAEAFTHVQGTARHSTHIGRREVTALQLLKHFLEMWDCRSLGLSARPSCGSSKGSAFFTTWPWRGGVQPSMGTPTRRRLSFSDHEHGSQRLWTTS